MLHYREQLAQKFNEAYLELNEKQRLAVDAIDGPVMVIAGPGTGKTQILAARVGKILLETDALPENILCLTYTDAGTIAMRKRLQQFVGADAYKVNIYTFHAFCHEVIQDNLSLFEKNSLDAISELESIELFKSLIDAFPKNHPLKRYRGDVYFEINNLKQLFSAMKKEGWTADFIHDKIDSYIADLPNRDAFIAKRASGNFKKGDVRTDRIAELVEKMEKLRAAVNEFENFQQLMRKRNRYDFEDMINWVIRAFDENRSILSAYQEKFQYILVDEFQDSSGTQNRLVQQLISYWARPNIFVVGDDDQSIFRFQGANVENMIEFAGKFSSDLITVVLTNNYRSTQPILDVSTSLISRNEERLVNQLPGLSKALSSSKPALAAMTNYPLIKSYLSAKDEMADICNAIVTLLDQGLAPGRIAVLYKENKYGEELGRYLRLKNIPVYSKRNVNILQQPFIKKIIQLLRYIHAEHDTPYGGDEMLFEILHYDFYHIPPMEIARITVSVNQQKYNSKEPVSIRRSLYEKAKAPAQNLFDTGLHTGLQQISRILEALIAAAPNITLQQLFAQLINEAGVLEYVLKSADKIQLMKWLTALFDFIKNETSRNPALDLKELIGIIDLMEKESLPLNIIEVSGTEKGVNLLTIHGSKGLEFEYVFLAGTNASLWEKKRKNNSGYTYPDNLFESSAAASGEEELRRLFYVALTRAEKHLQLSFAQFNKDGKEMEPSMFIAEIIEAHQLPIENIKLSTEQQSEYELLQYQAQAPQIEEAEADFISAILDKFVMNVTALNSYLNCPLGFYYKNLIRIPSGKSEATEFGSAIHHALDQLFTKMLDHPEKLFPSVTEMFADFSWYMHKHRENFILEAFNRRMEYGQEVLKNYYQKYIGTWNKIVTVERNIRGVTVNGVPLKGKLDKLEFNGTEVNVVDYKSGDIDKAISKIKGPNDKEPNGGDYWRQAVFYKILVDNYTQKNWKVISTEFDFVEPDKKKAYRKEKIIITPADMETVSQQVSAVWQKIQDRDFYTGCGKPECHWCNFVKDNSLAVALHEISDEEESTD